MSKREYPEEDGGGNKQASALGWYGIGIEGAVMYWGSGKLWLRFAEKGRAAAKLDMCG